MGAIFRFLGLCVCLGVQRGLSRVLIKYSGKYVKIYFNMKITCCYDRILTFGINSLSHLPRWELVV